jgi:hypothetical protein
MEERVLKKGDKVKWTSQSGGCTTTKEGEIVAVLFASDRQSPHEAAKSGFPRHRKMFDGWIIPGGNSVGYFIEVRDGKTDRAKPKLYMPYPGKLEKIN